MFLPIGDDQDHDRTPAVNWALIVLNAGAFLLFCIPLRKLEGTLLVAGLRADDVRPFALLAHMFLHANLLHIAGNMLFLWIFGRLVEERLGHVGYLLFYLFSGLAAAGLQVAAADHPGGAMIGASGAVSGTIGACLLFCPRAQIKVFVWFWFTMGTHLIPVTLWVLLWFAGQVWFSYAGLGNVGYFAHLGGFGGGYAAAWVVRAVYHRLHPRPGPPLEPKDSASLAEPRRAFAGATDDPDLAALDDTIDAYAVVTLRGAAPAAPRGVAARRLPRAAAEELRRTLQEQGVPAALIADQPANHVPAPAVAESASWDDRLLRMRVGNQSVPVLWSAPFLAVGAVVDEQAFIEIYLGRKAAYRIAERPGVGFTRVDPRRRSEERAGLGTLARDFERLREGRGADAGLRILAGEGDRGALAFTAAEYADYLFRLFHLARAGHPIREE